MPASLLGRHFWITAYAMLAAGLWLPGDYGGLRPVVPVFLGGILYFTCLKISLAEIRAAMRWQVLARVAALAPVRLVALPIACWATIAGLSPAWAAGVLLVAASPSGFSSVAFTDLYGGSRMFALLLVLVTSLLCPLTIPLLLDAFGPGGIDTAALAGRMGFLLVVLVTPFAAAQLTRALLPAFVERHHGRWGYGAILSGCLMIFVSVAANRHAWEGWPLASFAVPFGLACLVCAVGFVVGIASRAVVARGECIAFTCGEIWLNNGLAVAFAGQFFPGDAHLILPAVLMQVPIVATMALYGWWTRATAPPAPTA